MKQCSKCKEIKELNEFHKDSTTKDGLSYSCKLCKHKSNIINKDKNNKRFKEHYQKIKLIHNERVRKNYHNNRDKNIEYHRNRYANNKEQHSILCKKWRDKKYPKIELSEEQLRLKYDKRKLETKLRSWVKEAIKKELINSKSISILGCSIQECRQYIESQFLPEMNWSNYGKIWEIDHIVGCCNFDLFKLEEQQKCFHYTNLRPLFKTTAIAESFGYKDYIGNKNKTKYLSK